jgi:uncharacterized protein (DUF1501 family)
MHISRIQDITRRSFLDRASKLAITGGALPFAMNLANINDAAAFTGGDYRALVCVFLFGGNDYSNTLVPFDSANYDKYSAIRGGGAGQTAGGIAYGRAELAATALTTPAGQTLTDNIQYALSPSLPLLKARFDQGKLAAMLNVGPLVAPITAAQYNGGNRTAFPVPPRLFSHNDQQNVWQTFGAEGTTIGWGGRLGDLALSNSSNTNSLFTCISPSGSAVFLAGQQAFSYQIGPNGVIPVNGIKSALFGSTVASTALRTLMTDSRTHILEAEYNKVSKRSIDNEATMTGALANVALTTSFTPAVGTNSLAAQLNIVAKIIAARGTLGNKRQVFFVSLGGFDNHDFLLRDHARLLPQVDFALDAFYRATVEMGVADKVTAFTASDFGRTLASNGDGSDHGWGGHHFIQGGSVRGGRFYGTAPEVSVTGTSQVGQGRLLPTTSVDEYGAALGSWFGAGASELATIFPNLSRFPGTPGLLV